MLRSVPGESIWHHGARNHFSNWLRARAELALAEELRPRTLSEFEDAASPTGTVIGPKLRSGFCSPGRTKMGWRRPGSCSSKARLCSATKVPSG